MRQPHKVNLGFFTILPVVTVILLIIYFLKFELSWGIVIFSFIFAAATNLSITAGYHRLYAHRSYQATAWVRIALLAIGASAYQGSALKWSSDHRRHHNKVDSEEDPYTITKGFWFAHMGWLFTETEHDVIKAPDLEVDSMIVFQDKYYLPISIFMGFIFPMLVGWAMGDAFAGLLFGGALRILLTQQSTFFVNSLSHTLGKRPYCEDVTARDSIIVAFLTHGEGYHNYHHRFQTDYRNGIRWYHWDPTKWTIRFMSLLGLAKNLRRMPAQEILKARLQVEFEKIRSQGFSEEKIRNLKEQILSAQARMKVLKEEYQKQKMDQLRLEIAEAKIQFQAGMRLWKLYLAQSA